MFNAGQVYSPGGNDRINSLQDEDALTGTGDNPTLNLTLGNTNDNGSLIVTPTLNGIQTINAVFSNTDGTGLDLQDATGLQTLNVTRISSSLSNGAVGAIAAGARVELINLPATALSLDLRNSVAYADVNISYRNGELNGNETVSIDLSSAAIQDLVIGAQAIQTNHINTLVLNVESESHIQNLNLKGGSTEVANQKLVINAAADFILGDDADTDGDYLDDNSALWAGIGGSGAASRLAEIEVTGAGNVTIGEVSGRAAGMILNGGAATGNIAVNVTNAAAIAASSFTTGSGNDTVVSTANLAADLATGEGADTVTVSANVLATSAIDLGAGNDALTVGLAAVQNGVDVLNGWIAGSVAGGATVDLGEGDDTLTLGDVANVSIGEEAVVNTGAGNDTVVLSGAIAGDTAGGLDGDTLGGELNVGEGDNTVTFDLEGQTDQGTLISGLLTAGAGTNVLTVTGNANATVVATDAADADRVTGFQTLNLVSEQSVTAALAAAVNAIVAGTTAENDDNLQTADYVVNVAEFTGLTAINLENRAGIIDPTPEEAVNPNRFVGDAATYTLNNLTGAETLTLATVEAATGVEARVVGTATNAQIAADVAIDATVNMTRATAGAVAITLNEGVDGTVGDVKLDDTGVGAQLNNINTINVTVNGAGSRTLDLSNDFDTAATLDGDIAAGSKLTVINVDSKAFTSTVAADIDATFAKAQDHTIVTGAGNDRVDLLADTVNRGDNIDLGGGRNRIVVDDDLRGNSGLDADENFDFLKNIQELELVGGGAANQYTLPGGVAGTMEVTLDDDAFTTGVDTVILSKDALGANATVDLDIGKDFDRALTIELAEGSTIDIDNAGDVDLTINVDARTTPVAAGGVPGTATINFTDAGTGTVALSIRVDDVAQTINQAGGDVVITNADATAEIDSITLLDSNTVAGGAPAVGGDQTGVITLTTHSTWAQAGDTLTIDASDINNDDRGGVNSDNQTVTINAGGAGIAYAVKVTGSQVDDTITGTNQADTIDGQAGDDTITGGVGADTLTGGTGADTFVYNSVNDSRGVSGVDAITDFTTGTDKLQIAVNVDQTIVDVVNLARFNNTATTVGSALVELDGAPAARIIDAGYSTDGKYFIDLDGDGNINNTTDLRIDIANTVNAGDINYVVTLTSDGNNDDVVRGGQGADTINGSADTDIFVMVGSITSAQANAYLAAETAVPGSVIPAVLNDVLDISELTTVRAQSEVNTGDRLNVGGLDAGDTLHVFGTANLALINAGGALNVGAVVVHSDITLSVAQLDALTTLTIDGDAAHTIKVVRADGSQLSNTDVANVLNGTDYDADGDGVTDVGSGAALTPLAIVVVNSGDNTTIQLGTAAAVNAETFVTVTVPAATTEGLTITSAMTADEIEAALAGGTAAKVVATGMTPAQLAKVVTAIAGVAEITGALALTNDLDAAGITALFGKYDGTTATVVATGMTNQFAVIADNIAKVADNGITGTMALNDGNTDATDLGLLLGAKTAAAATVNIDATSMDAGELTAISTGIAKVDGIANLSLTDGQSAAEIGNLLSKATDAEVVATTMNSTKVDALVAGAAGIAADGITGTIAAAALLSVTDFTALAAKIDDAATVTVADTGSALAALGNAALDSAIDTLDATDDVMALTELQLANITNAKLAAGDAITLSGVVDGAGVDATNIDFYDTGVATLTGAAETLATDVDAVGEWHFAANVGADPDADELTYFDGTATVTITLTGVAAVTLGADGVFTLS